MRSANHQFEHHGIIEVDSQIDYGSTFRIYLPVIDSVDAVTARQTDQTIRQSHKHETLLLVDDEPLVLHSMKDVLQEMG